MKRFVAAGVGMITLFFAGCNTAKPPVVSAAPPAHSDLAVPPANIPDDAFVASGPVVVENQLDVAALREGVIAEIDAQPGDHVHTGQLLAKLDDRQISADVEAAAARVRSIEANLQNWKAETRVLQADLERARKLWAANVITKEELEHAQYKEEADEYETQREAESLNNARETLKSLELEKEKTRIAAPFDSVVARRYIRVGQKVAVGDRLFWVSAMAPLEVKFTLPERFLRKVREGDRLSVTSADLPGQTKYSAKVIQISPVVDPSSGTIEVLARVIDSAAELRPGMLVNISLPNPQ
jgi:membrane fusion protein, multidrug efflux system